MRQVLVGPVTIEIEPEAYPRFADTAWVGYEPPLGILTLASVLRGAGSDPVVFDLDGFLREFLAAEGNPRKALAAAVAAVASFDASLFGFGTICGSYPFTLRLAEQVHRLRPEARIVLGGPQASAVDVRTLEEFAFIDAVIRGETDQIAVRALEQIVRGVPVDVPGVTHRSQGRIVRNPEAPIVLDLDDVPAPAFDLCPHLAHCTRLPVEIGRGCPFACTFCSTNDFFRRRFRMRSPQCVLGEMRRLEGLFGVTDFDLVHDMFTVDRKRVVEFCHFMLANGSGYTWHCSARTDFVDRELIGIMQAAGCRSLFFGVETGSARLQKVIGKDLGIQEAAMAIEMTHQAGMQSTVSLIVGFPEETVDDLNATASFALNAARFDSARVQVGMLAALAGTPLYKTWRHALFFDGIVPEQSRSGWGQGDADRELIERHPDLFSSFYGVPAGAGREYTGEFRWFIKYALKRCRWLAIALGRHRDSFLAIYDTWRFWEAVRPRSLAYYTQFDFAEDLCRFVAERLVTKDLATDPAIMMASYYSAMHAILREPAHRQALDDNERPHIPPNITLLDFPFRPARIIDTLRLGQPADEGCLQPTAVAFRREGDRIVDARELPAFAANVLRLCDGGTTVAQMARALGDSCPPVPGLSAEHFLLAGLQSLRQEGLIQIGEIDSLAGARN